MCWFDCLDKESKRKYYRKERREEGRGQLDGIAQGFLGRTAESLNDTPAFDSQ